MQITPDPRPLMRAMTAAAAVSLLALPTLNAADLPPPGVRVNSVGYTLDVPKKASISGVPEGVSSFAVVDAASGKVVHKGQLNERRYDTSWGRTVAVADFTDFTEEGEYQVRVEGLPDSPAFRIGPQALNEALLVEMLGFYGLRCGTDVAFDYKGDHFAHNACHLDDGYLDHYDPARAGERKDGTGGWHDAGDYGKYTVNAGFSTAIMLVAWQEFDDQLEGLSLPIPEQGGELPDYLDELKYNLDWILKMQFEDGKVAHKLTRENFSGFVMPSEDTEKRYFTPWGTLAMADFVAVGCIAARVYEPYDAEYAAKWKEAVKKTWAELGKNWSDVNPDLSAFTTGAYQNTTAYDRNWALIEMWLTFGDEGIGEDGVRALKALLAGDDPVVRANWGWGNGLNIGIFNYALSERSDRDPEIVAAVQQDVLAAADRLLANHDAHPYGRSLTSFGWGVNGAVMQTTMNLWTAYCVSGDEEYRDAAFDQVSYMLGRNPLARSFVTGLGHNPPMFPHHRPSAADDVKAPWPGHLVGGPHPGELDWKDDEADYTVNENAINWDAAMVFGLSIFYNAEPR